MTNEDMDKAALSYATYDPKWNRKEEPVCFIDDQNTFKAGRLAALEWEKQQKCDYAYIDQYEAHRYLVSVIKDLRNEIEELKRQK